MSTAGSTVPGSSPGAGLATGRFLGPPATAPHGSPVVAPGSKNLEAQIASESEAPVNDGLLLVDEVFGGIATALTYVCLSLVLIYRCQQWKQSLLQLGSQGGQLLPSREEQLHPQERWSLT